MEDSARVFLVRRGRPKHDDILTSREWQVLDFIQEGLTNEQIGERLRISLSGVKYHVSEILSKLGVGSRAEAVQFVEGYRGQQRTLPLIVWLFPKSSPSVAGLAAVGALAVALLALIGFVTMSIFGAFASGSRLERSAGLPASEAGTDISQEGQALSNQSPGASTYEATLLLAKSTPTNVGTEAATINALRRVRTVAELEAALHPGINLIVVDRSSLDDIGGSDILYRHLKAGNSIMGLNVSNSDLREATNYVRLVNERRTDPDGPALPEIREPTVRGEGFYSVFLFRDTALIGGNQRYFFEGLFEGDVGSLDRGSYLDAPPTFFKIADLPEERISVNKGMGCTHNEEKTAAVAKRELAAAHPDAEVSEVMIVYCNPDASGNVVLGALLPQKQEPEIFMPPAGCVNGNGMPSSEPRCLPPPRTTSAARTVRISVALAELVP
ncbi:MAG: hypothetical protein GEU75_10535 [Dehalococcoidia bacterium]|nr:hypothetical protein [Dehalococcoidia bacterium]